MDSHQLLACVLSRFSHVRVFVILWTVALQALLSMGFSRQEYRSVLPFPSPGDLPILGTEFASPALTGRFFTMVSPGKPPFFHYIYDYCFMQLSFKSDRSKTYYQKNAFILFISYVGPLPVLFLPVDSSYCLHPLLSGSRAPFSISHRAGLLSNKFSQFLLI